MKFNALTPEYISKRYRLVLEQVAGISMDDPKRIAKLEIFIEEHPQKWWHGVWVACEIKGEPGKIDDQAERALCSPEDIFANARLNIAENLLGYGPRTHLAVRAWAEDGPRGRWSFGRLKEMAGRFASGFAGLGLVAGDAVILNLPNVPEKVAAFIGANWLGLVSVLEPPWQENDTDILANWQALNSKLIITCDGYRRNGQWIDRAPEIEKMCNVFSAKTPVIPVPCAGSRTDFEEMDGIYSWNRFEQMGQGGGRAFTYVTFDHEMAKIRLPDGPGYQSVKSGSWILSASASWRLLLDPVAGSHIFSMDTGSQHDWLLGLCALTTENDIVVYDGTKSAMNGQVIWRILEREHTSVVRLNRNIIAALMAEKTNVRDNHNLDYVQWVLVPPDTSEQEKNRLIETCFPNARIIR